MSPVSLYLVWDLAIFVPFFHVIALTWVFLRKRSPEGPFSKQPDGLSSPPGTFVF